MNMNVNMDMIMNINMNMIMIMIMNMNMNMIMSGVDNATLPHDTERWHISMCKIVRSSRAESQVQHRRWSDLTSAPCSMKAFAISRCRGAARRGSVPHPHACALSGRPDCFEIISAVGAATCDVRDRY